MLIDVVIQLRSVRRNCTSTQVTVMKATPISATAPSMRVAGSARTSGVADACRMGLFAGWVSIAFVSCGLVPCLEPAAVASRCSVRRGDAIGDLLLQRTRIGGLQVGLRDDAAQLAVLVHDRHAADAV